MRALPSYGQAPAMSKPSVATEVHQSLNIHLNLTPKITLHADVRFDVAADR